MASAQALLLSEPCLSNVFTTKQNDSDRLGNSSSLPVLNERSGKKRFAQKRPARTRATFLSERRSPAFDQYKNASADETFVTSRRINDESLGNAERQGYSKDIGSPYREARPRTSEYGEENATPYHGQDGRTRHGGKGAGHQRGAARSRGRGARRGHSSRGFSDRERDNMWAQEGRQPRARVRMRSEDALAAFGLERGRPIAEVLDNWPGSLSMPEWNRLLRLVESIFGIRAALEVVKWMKGREDCRPNTIIYTTLLGLLGKNRLSALATKVLSEMTDPVARPDIKCYNSAISAQFGSKAFEQALDIMDRMKADRSVCPTEVTYNALINTGVKARVNPERLGKLLIEMQEANLMPNSRTYTGLISAFAKAGKFDGAYGLLKEMRTQGAEPDTVTYNVLLDSLGPAGRTSEAETLVEEMRQQGLQPSMSTYSILIKHFGREKQWEKAEEAFRNMQRAGIRPDVVVYGTLIDVFGRAGEWERAENVFEEMLRSGVDGNAAVFNGLIMGYGKSGQADKARAILQRMNRAGVAPTVVTYNAILDTFAREKRVEDMEAVFRDMLLGQYAPNLITWNTLLKGYGEAQRMKSLDETLRKMALSGVEPDTVSWTTVAVAYERAGLKRVAAMAWARAGPKGARQRAPLQELNQREADSVVRELMRPAESVYARAGSVA